MGRAYFRPHGSQDAKRHCGMPPGSPNVRRSRIGTSLLARGCRASWFLRAADRTQRQCAATVHGSVPNRAACRTDMSCARLRATTSQRVLSLRRRDAITRT